ncbi:hypothetical protein Ahy_A02g007936 [Arachis hypogaea]|uniref:Retrotransposon gag domain-containing protein n=1 Tax=Arachis hypogaea TaxID=3818 RepID=A0A445EE26_ARAHY|nr:hypothetical protein Ahy_A02g007936 [Arachis hypogaea]
MEEMRQAQNRSLEAQNRSFELLSTNLLRQVREMFSQHHDQGRNGAGGRNGGDGEGSEGRGGNNNEGETEQRRFEPTRKLDIPIFSGDDANGWLVKMERYFRVAQVALAERMNFVTLALEGEALAWMEWLEEYTPFQTWRRFKEDLLKRFQPGAALNPMAPLLEVKQVEDVAQYRREFEAAA